ncbi:MAG TPA: mandelate racemase/muconate lactonizing enzyme family protein [Vicinamibacterales bacterium]|nr:mandelate racemase/muconate lactonizing enzyme family protein [Vicinamibacterales bacterium]
MNIDRRTFTKTLMVGGLGALAPSTRAALAAAARGRTPPALARAAAALPATAKITKIRCFYPKGYDRNGPQAFPQSNMVVLVDTDTGITGIGQGGSPDTIRNVSRSVIGRNPFDTESIWQYEFMDGFYSPGKERLHAMGAIDIALWDIKGKALNVPLYQFFGGRTREFIELYATNGLPQEAVPPGGAQPMGLKERAAATMAAGYRVYRVDAGILPSTGDGRGGGGRAGAAGPAAGGPGGAAPGGARGGGPGGAPGGGARGGGPGGGGRGQAVFNARARIPQIIKALEQIREGVGPEGDWMIDLHQRFDFQEAVEICRLMEPLRPFIAEDPLREEQFRTQIPKLRLLTSVPLAPGEEWSIRADFSTLVENRDIDFARVSLPNTGGITEMLKIMALCDTHKVGIVPHFTGPVATAGHMHTMTAFPGQVLMEYNQGQRPVPYLPEFLECRNGKVWPNDRPGLGVSIDEKQLDFVEEMTQGAPGPTLRRPDGTPTHW